LEITIEIVNKSAHRKRWPAVSLVLLAGEKRRIEEREEERGCPSCPV
jgi:hypothetical protein